MEGKKVLGVVSVAILLCLFAGIKYSNAFEKTEKPLAFYNSLCLKERAFKKKRRQLFNLLSLFCFFFCQPIS